MWQVLVPFELCLTIQIGKGIKLDRYRQSTGAVIVMLEICVQNLTSTVGVRRRVLMN
jgi:hypothetical protein